MSKRSFHDALGPSLSEPTWQKRRVTSAGQSTGSVGPSWSTGGMVAEDINMTASSALPAVSSPSAQPSSLASAMSNQHLAWAALSTPPHAIPSLLPQHSSSSWQHPSGPPPVPSPAPAMQVGTAAPLDESMDVASIDGGDVGMRAAPTEEGAGEALHRTASAPELRMLLDPATAAAYNPMTHVLQPQHSGVIPSISSNAGALVPYKHAQDVLREGIYREMHRTAVEHHRRLRAQAAGPSCIIEELDDEGIDDGGEGMGEGVEQAPLAPWEDGADGGHLGSREGSIELMEE